MIEKNLGKIMEFSNKKFVGFYMNFMKLNAVSGGIVGLSFWLGDSSVGQATWTASNSVGEVKTNHWNRSLWTKLLGSSEYPVIYPARFDKVDIFFDIGCTAELVIDGLGVAGNIERMPDENNYYVFEPQSPFYYFDRFGDEPNVLEVESLKSIKSKAENYELGQNYPNPFNPSTKIEFRITGYEFVTLKVYDMLGREVATLVNERKAPGTYIVQWNSGNLPSGTYFYTIRVGNWSERRKMVIVR
jgi:hypothetical protein